jgi:hypothetical protein
MLNCKKIWVFGDSYTTPNFCVKPEESFWGLAANYFSVESAINLSWPGCSWTSVQHNLISQQTEYDWNKDFFIIGMPPLERLTIFDNYKDTKYQRHVFTHNWQHQKELLQCHNGLDTISGHTAKDLIIYSDRSWLETQVLNSVFLLTQWLESKNANYLIVNLSKPLDSNNKWGPTIFNLDYCLTHPRCVLFDNTYFSVNENMHKPADFKTHGWMGHHGAAGNKHFFEVSIRNKLLTPNQ